MSHIGNKIKKNINCSNLLSLSQSLMRNFAQPFKKFELAVGKKKKFITEHASDPKKNFLYIYTSHYILDIVTICLIHYVQSNILLKIRAEYLQP